MESWLWNPGCGILAVKSWLWNPGCGILAVESWLWTPGCGLLAVESRLWNPGCELLGYGILAMESWLWNPGCGILAVASWLWNPGCGILAVESWSWNPGCGVVVVGTWLWNPGCGILAGESWLWSHLGDTWETPGRALGGTWEVQATWEASGGKVWHIRCVLQCLRAQPSVLRSVWRGRCHRLPRLRTKVGERKPARDPANPPPATRESARTPTDKSVWGNTRLDVLQTDCIRRIVLDVL